MKELKEEYKNKILFEENIYTFKEMFSDKDIPIENTKILVLA